MLVWRQDLEPEFMRLNQQQDCKVGRNNEELIKTKQIRKKEHDAPHL